MSASEAASGAVQLGGGWIQAGQAGEVSGGGCQFEPELAASPAQVSQLAAGADGLDPAEHLFDQLAPTLAAMETKAAMMMRPSSAASVWAVMVASWSNCQLDVVKVRVPGKTETASKSSIP